MYGEVTEIIIQSIFSEEARAFMKKITQSFLVFLAFFLLTQYQVHTYGFQDSAPLSHTIAGKSGTIGGKIIPRTKWSLKYVSSEDTVNGAATNAFDGNTNTLWHTQYLDNNNSSQPYEIQINLGAQYTMKGFRYLPSQNGTSTGQIGQYEFYVSEDGTNWGTAVATGTFEDDALEKEVLFTQTKGQFIRLKALTEVHGSPWISMAEINVLGVPLSNQAPNGTIDTPDKNLTISAGGSVRFSGTGTDHDTNTPLTYVWNFGDPEIADSTREDPGLVQFHNTGTFTVTYTVTDALGLSDPTPATRIITVRDTSNKIIPQADWSVNYVDSEELFSEDGEAENTFDGNTDTIWHTRYSGSNDHLQPHDIQINLGRTYQIEGFRYVPRQDSCSIGRIKLYEFYVSDDGASWDNPVSTGIFDNDEKEKEVLITTATGKYVRLRSLTEVNGFPWTSMSEIKLLGYPSNNQAPNGIINTPSWHTTIQVGDSVKFTGTGTDPDNTIPLTYMWDFGDSGIANSTVEDPGLLRFNNTGTFAVTFTVTDVLGCSDPTPATRVITVNNSSSTSGLVVPKINWNLWYVDSEELAGNDGAADNAFDGKTGTFWHTEWYNDSPLPPHEIQIDLGATYDISGFRYLPRQDGSHYGWIDQYEFYVSDDGASWGSPAAGGSFANTSKEKEVLFSPKNGRFIRLRAVTEVNDNPWTSMAEINVLYQCSEPFVQILQPQDCQLQSSRNITVSASTCLTSDGGVKFILDGGTGGGTTYIDYHSPFEATFSNVSRSEHTIEAFLVDSSGNTISGTMTYDTVTKVGVGDYYVAVGDSITFGSGDDDTSDDTSADGRNTGGGYTPILNDLLTQAKGYPHRVANEGVPGDSATDGILIIPSLLNKHPNAQRYLVQYGTNDSAGLLPVPSGKGLTSGDTGYPGSFKDRMQQITTLINNAGKKVCLAKVPYTLAPQRNTLIQDYNIVIDELKGDTTNNITVTPPDFYGYFEIHQEEFFDSLHPNGTGYRSMANLWLASLN